MRHFYGTKSHESDFAFFSILFAQQPALFGVRFVPLQTPWGAANHEGACLLNGALYGGVVPKTRGQRPALLRYYREAGTVQTMKLPIVDSRGGAKSPTDARRGKWDEQDVALIDRIARKDSKALETLYYRYSPRLGSFLLRLIKRRDLVDEVINDVMLIVWQRSGEFNSSRRFSTWLFGIAQNKALKAIERSSRKTLDPPAFGTDAWDENDLDKLQVSDETERAISNWQEGRAIARALDTLPTEQRAVVKLTFFEGFSYREIAIMTDCPVNTVKTRMHYARRRLAEILDKSVQ